MVSSIGDIMAELINLQYVFNSVIFSLIGIVIYIIGAILLDVLTPKVQVWKEVVEKQNLAVAVLLGSVAIGIAQIIASAIHG